MRIKNVPHRQIGAAGGIDALIWLGVIIGVIAFVVAVGAYLKTKAGNVKNAVWHTQFVERALDVYDPQNNCAGISATNLVNLNAVPQELLRGGQIIDAWGGTVTVTAATTVVPNDTMVITYPAVPAEECSSYVTSIERGHFRVDVNGITVKNIPQNVTFNVGTLATACSGSNPKRVSLYSRCR